MVKYTESSEKIKKEKGKIEETFNVKIEFEEGVGIAKIKAKSSADPLAEIKAKEAITAINAGIGMETALKLKSDDFSIASVDVEELVGRKKKDVERQIARIIGRKGKVKNYIAEATETEIVVKERTVFIIGKPENVEAAKDAIEMLASGSKHASVYRMLEKIKSMERERRALLWK